MGSGLEEGKPFRKLGLDCKKGIRDEDRVANLHGPNTLFQQLGWLRLYAKGDLPRSRGKLITTGAMRTYPLEFRTLAMVEHDTITFRQVYIPEENQEHSYAML